MSRFERPANTITDVNELKVGDHVWHVYGIWPPQMGGGYIITKQAGPFCEHHEYSDIHEGSADQLVFDERWVGGQHSTMNFASDCNMLVGYSHNDNYCFRSEADALAAIDWLRLQWEQSGRIAEEVARRKEDRLFYDYAE